MKEAGTLPVKSDTTGKISVRRRLFVPILCAMVVTVFSLRYYNHQKAERLTALKLMPVQRISTREIHNSTLGRSGGHPGNHVKHKVKWPSEVQNENSKHSEKSIVRRDVRSADGGNPALLFRNTAAEPVVAKKQGLTKNHDKSLFAMLESFRHRSHSSTIKTYTQITTLSGNHERGVTNMNSKMESTTPKVEVSTVTTVPLKTDENQLTNPGKSKEKVPKRNEKSLSLQAGPLGMSYKQIQTGNSSWSVRVAADAGLKSNSDLTVSIKGQLKSSNLTTQGSNSANNTLLGKIFWKRRLLKTTNYSLTTTDGHPVLAPFVKDVAQNMSKNMSKSDPAPYRLQRAWDQSVQTLNTQKASLLQSNQKNISNISLNQTSLKSFKSTNVSQILNQDPLNASTPSKPLQDTGQSRSLANVLLNTDSPKPILMNQFSRQTKKSLQEIWDNSIKGLEKKNTNVNASDSHQVVKHYLGEKMSLQDIWDNSVSKVSTQEPGKKIQKGEKEIQQSGQIQNERAENPQPREGLEVMPKGDGGKSDLAKVPDVSLSADHLPPKSMRSKVLQFSYQPQAGKKYAVISVAAIGTDYNYAFTLPLTVLSWQRIGYGVIVFAVGSEEYWVSNPVLYYILKELRLLDPILLFFDVPEENRVFMSQASRIFACNMFDWRGLESTPLVMSDVDIWPLTKEMYDIPAEKQIVSLNSECCGSFRHRGQMFKMVPMCNVIMSVKTWQDLIGVGVSGSRPVSERDIIDYFKLEFGNMVEQRVSKGENDGWFLDQHMVSVRIGQYAQQHGSETVQYEPRDTGRDRVDRNYWFPYGITRRNDIHVLEQIYQPGTWERAIPILRQMYNETKNSDLEQYRDGFISMLLNYKSPS